MLDFMQNERKSLKQKKSPSTKMVATLYKEERIQDKEKEHLRGIFLSLSSAKPN